MKTAALALLALTALPGAEAQPRCADLAAQYDATLKEIEEDQARSRAAAMAARISDRAALLDSMIALKCPLPERLLSRGYAFAAQNCELRRKNGSHAPDDPVLSGLPADLREAMSLPVEKACDQKLWIYRLD